MFFTSVPAGSVPDTESREYDLLYKMSVTYRLGPYLVVDNRWAGRSAPVLLLQLLQLGLGQPLGELMLQLEETKQIRFKE